MNRSIRAATGIALIAGLAWLGFSCFHAVHLSADADVYRQWTVSQYVRAGINPYKVGLDILRLNFGDMSGTNRLRLRDLVIYEVHPHFRSDGVENVLPEYGPPTPTYPPSSLLFLVFTVGALPHEHLHAIWLVVNLLSLAWLIRSCARASHAPLLATAALVLLRPPTHEVIRTSQFGFLVMIWLLSAMSRFEKDTVGEILFFTLVLLKPSLVLPFFALPFVRARWLTLAVAGGIHLAGSLTLCNLIDTPLPQVLGEWLRIPGYVLQGAYTVQEIINRLGVDNTPAGTALSLGVAGVAGLWCLAYRHADPWRHAALLAFTAILWTYHERYDFILLLIPARFLWQKLCRGGRPGRGEIVEGAAYVVLALALTDMIYLTDHPAAWLLRWCGRAALAGLAVHAAVALRADDLRTRTPPAS